MSLRGLRDLSEMSQITGERRPFPCDGGLVGGEEASWHTGVASLVKANKAGSYVVTLTQEKGRDERLGQAE